MSFLFSPFFLIPIILVGWAQMRVRSAFKKYSQVPSMARLSGAETARRILSEQGIYDVAVEETGGSLSDHYDPSSKVVRLSSDNFHGHHLAGLAVAAHEVGHAIQHANGYLPLNLRHAILPVANLGSSLGFPMVIGGMLFGFTGLIDIGILFFAGAVIFQLVTLPVEFNASSRAMAILSQGYLAGDEVSSAKKVLNAAAMTYVAAAATAVMQLVHLLLMRGSDD
ncbi:MAG: zinc metallopeptidase [Gemmatimonadetes bacterium]|jgi:Zn-dependent membrane protease YugP|nr:zinc metallopeptidase [Gemmatimonadota bacterium]MDE0962992.1 zinc metallopeptidase [Candidatus Latescibacterota bacterium]MBT5327598.1 zinc metallopeptidase [Gemmatimonadota bacterium]MBT5451430.1 zinc metallopeptidase [Gemmatimonadota bacterium]MBT5805616.1 zinc metallopeptidase [Gemmatimonadota bacterium]|tara:strand:- start:406 stop:1077 length:672 start_codon:yes stop_codon:yes gene_type:complete